ncbi:peptidase C14, caspase domain-containing protein [Mycena vulgaris]|nr:peptidase C14, caspase domain-containing protein [Mycena vulgaris]
MAVTQRTTRSPRKKALLIGIGYAGTKSQEVLDLPHDDVSNLKQFLIESYGYSPQNVTLMLDKPGELQPTLQNIRKQAASLVAGAAPGDHFFFYYGGHSVQVPELSTEEHTEIDGLDEVIVPSDGRTTSDKLTRESCLVDNELHRLLVNPLPEGSTLMAVLDTCHSASLLDLDHEECNAGWSCFRGHTGTSPVTAMGQMISVHGAHGRLSPKLPPKSGPRASISRKAELTREAADSIASLGAGAIPQHRACARIKHSGKMRMPGGFEIRRCESPQVDQGHKALVTCLSACRDDQLAYENKHDKNGGSFTERLLNILRKDPHPRLEDLMADISVSIHGMLLDAVNIKELNNCQDPQMSSGTEMDVKAYLETL